MKTSPILTLNDVNISFLNADNQSYKALHGASLVVNKGQVLGIIGESGSGKSITFLSLMRLLPKYAQVEGIALFHHKNKHEVNLFALSDSALRKYALNHISYIFQDPLSALNPALRIGKQMLECIQNKETKQSKKATCIQMLQEVMPGMEDRAFNAYPHQLSGGQRQRVMIAMALLNKPDLIIADEPTTALDPEVQVAILKLLVSMVKKYDCSLVLISHDIQSIADFCDQIAVFYKGQIVEYNNSKSIVEHPQNPYTKALINCRPQSQNEGFFLPTIQDFMGQKEYHKSPMPPIAISEEQLMQADNISQIYPPNFEALKPMNFHLNKGECIGIIGQSGSGKSTLAKLLVQLEHPVTGNLALNQNLAKTQIQMVFQDPYSSLNPALRIGDAITEVIAIHHPNLNRNERVLLAEKLLEETGIDPTFMHKKPASFSGGQRQRICIARALAANPEVLVCDEAVAALDISVQAQVINLLKKLQFSRGLSIVFITHDMQIAKHMCNRILVLYDGNLVEEGETNAIFQKPTHPYAKKLIAHYHA